MSYLASPLGATTPPTKPGFIWVEPSKGKPGYWRRALKGETATPSATLTVRRPPPMTAAQKAAVELMRKHGPTCDSAGVLARDRTACIQALSRGAKIEDFRKGLSKRVVREHRPEVLAQECAATGMPPELIPLCVEGRQAGASLEAMLEQLSELTPDQLAEIGLEPEQIPETGSKMKLLMYGGAAAAAVGLVLFLRTRKKKS